MDTHSEGHMGYAACATAKKKHDHFPTGLPPAGRHLSRRLPGAPTLTYSISSQPSPNHEKITQDLG